MDNDGSRGTAGIPQEWLGSRVVVELEGKPSTVGLLDTIGEYGVVLWHETGYRGAKYKDWLEGGANMALSAPPHKQLYAWRFVRSVRQHDDWDDIEDARPQGKAARARSWGRG